jgi:hypothetical protein
MPGITSRLDRVFCHEVSLHSSGKYNSFDYTVSTITNIEIFFRNRKSTMKGTPGTHSVRERDGGCPISTKPSWGGILHYPTHFSFGGNNRIMQEPLNSLCRHSYRHVLLYHSQHFRKQSEGRVAVENCEKNPRSIYPIGIVWWWWLMMMSPMCQRGKLTLIIFCKNESFWKYMPGGSFPDDIYNGWQCTICRLHHFLCIGETLTRSKIPHCGLCHVYFPQSPSE